MPSFIQRISKSSPKEESDSAWHENWIVVPTKTRKSRGGSTILVGSDKENKSHFGLWGCTKLVNFLILVSHVSYLWLQVLQQWQLCPRYFERNKNTPPCPLSSRCGSPANHSYEQKTFLLPLHWHCQLYSCVIIYQLGHSQVTVPTVCIMVFTLLN